MVIYSREHPSSGTTNRLFTDHLVVIDTVVWGIGNFDSKCHKVDMIAFSKHTTVGLAFHGHDFDFHKDNFVDCQTELLS